MEKTVNSIIALAFILLTGYGAKKILFEVKKESLLKIDKGLSPSEPFARKLTGERLDF